MSMQIPRDRHDMRGMVCVEMHYDKWPTHIFRISSQAAYPESPPFEWSHHCGERNPCSTRRNIRPASPESPPSSGVTIAVSAILAPLDEMWGVQGRRASPATPVWVGAKDVSALDHHGKQRVLAILDQLVQIS